MTPCRRVLFLCTGNYYRSRFAEELFNDLAKRRGLGWRADSRALNIELGRRVNHGPISIHTRQALAGRGIKLSEPVREPRGCDKADLEQADRVIALKEAEHRPLMERDFPGYAQQTEYWHVSDLDAAGPEEALTQTESLVIGLIRSLESEDKLSQPVADENAPAGARRPAL